MSASLCYPHQVDENNEESAMVYQTASGSSDRGTGPGPVVGLTFCDAQFLVAYNNQVSVDYGIQEKSGVVPCYRVREPIGYALLLGCDRTPDDPKPLLIKQDLVLMEETLSDGGWVVGGMCTSKYNSLSAVSLNLIECNRFLNSLKDDPALNLDKYSCFLFYYSGHGISEGLLLSDGRCIPYEEIVTRISSIPALVNKPKIFIFDSCRTAIDRKKESQGFWNYMHLPFNKSIDKRHSEQKMKDYPPPHTVISFSACEGMPSFADDNSGSFYTRDLANKLKQLGKLLSFGEILTLVNGGAALLAQGAKKEQRPVTYCSLDRLLVLNCDGLRNTLYIALENIHMNTAQAVGLPGGKPAVSKGPYFPSHPETPDHDVVADAVGKGPLPGRKFKTRQDVLNNLPKLGRDLSVFICYIPDPESPYSDPKDRNREAVIGRNQILVTHLIRDLERHGFNVISDLHLGDTQPLNWLQWYTSRIDLCDYLIMVCSPAFRELFSCEQPRYHIPDERVSQFMCYRQAMYANIEREVRETPNTSKFIPVILDRAWTVDNSVPTLFAMAKTYQLYSDIPRKFDYDEEHRDFEMLVCRMAGIERMKLDKHVDQGIQQLPPVYGQTDVVPMLSGHNPNPPGPRKGYRQRQSRLVQPARANNPHSTLGAGRSGASRPGYRLTQQTQQTILPYPQATPQNGSVYSQGPINPATHIPNSQLAQAPPPVPPTVLPALPFADKSPDSQVILWLCDRLISWKFFARYLRIRESYIEGIVVESRDNIREQRYKMFDTWRRQSTLEYSYRTLGDVILHSEDNRGLYPDFCAKVAEVEQRNMQTNGDI